GAPRYSDRLLIRLFRVTLGGARRVGYHRRIIQTEFLHETVRRIWGYDRFLPLQQEAIEGVLAGRDSLVVLPTGGGKSLCYQAPAAHLRRLAVVVSPLIALMKDQVDGLRQAGAPAVRDEIVAELRLRNPLVLVGSFDRRNLVYRVRPRTDRLAQVVAAINRHRDQAGIVYCIRRSEVDELTAALTRRGFRALRYHA